MQKYYVVLADGAAGVDGDDVRLTDGGDLLIYIKSELVKAFARGEWKRVIAFSEEAAPK